MRVKWDAKCSIYFLTGPKLMCGVCGCDNHHHSHSEIVDIEQNILTENDQYANRNKFYFSEKKIFTINLVSSPGSGKTTLLTKTLQHYQHKIPMAVIVGDQHTDLDADRLRQTGVPTLQINTGKMCHLDAHHIHHAVEDLSLHSPSILWIENVGNLVCPALFALGEASRIVILSVTEGEDKPLKYPYMFQDAELMVINKMDLLPYVDFNVARCIEYARRINPQIQIVQTAAVNNEGLQTWFQWLTQRYQQQLQHAGVCE